MDFPGVNTEETKKTESMDQTTKTEINSNETKTV